MINFLIKTRPKPQQRHRSNGRFQYDPSSSDKKDFILWGSLIHKKISQNLIYPPKAKNRNISGKVHVYLSIKASGEILNKYIEKNF